MQRAAWSRATGAMRPMWALVAGCLTGWLFAAAAFAADIPAGGVRWQSTVSVKAMGITMPGQTAMLCMDPKSDAPPIRANNGCEIYDYQRAGDTQSFKMRCTGRLAMAGNGTLTYSGDTFRGSIRLQVDQGSMSMEFSGSRQGACDGSEVNLLAKQQLRQAQASTGPATAVACAHPGESAYPPRPSVPGADGACKDEAAHKPKD